jgi:hypothetical protein
MDAMQSYLPDLKSTYCRMGIVESHSIPLFPSADGSILTVKSFEEMAYLPVLWAQMLHAWRPSSSFNCAPT